jgi:hypothetical protein
VHEHIRAAFLGDEAEPLRVIEPLHCALCHLPFLLKFLLLQNLSAKLKFDNIRKSNR